MYSLTQATAKDAALLSRLWQETFTQAYSEVHTPENIDRYCADNFTRAHAETVLSDPSTHCVIARDGDKPVGYVLLKTGTHSALNETEFEASAIELKQIYILADVYGKGLGRTLYEMAVSTARDHGCQTLWLSVSDINERALAFYRKLNFTPIGAGPTFSVGTDRLTSTLMAKSIA